MPEKKIAKKRAPKKVAPIKAQGKGTVTVSYGVHRLENQKLEGKQVGNIRRELEQSLNIDPRAENVVNGKKVNSDYVLKQSDQLEFVKRAGDKGC